MKSYLFVTVVLLSVATVTCITSCNVQQPSHWSGVALCKNMIKPPGHNDFVKMDYIKYAKFYFKDNLIIEERIGFTNETKSGKEVITEFTDHYTFINLQTKEHYDYKTFSDTAKPIRKFSDIDTIKVNGGFDFFALKDTPFSTSGVPISDTSFEGFTYKRMAFDSTYTGNDGNPEKIRHVAYLRCDLKGLVVSLEKKLSLRMGCPVVRSEWINLLNGGVIAAEIEISSLTLSPQELNVFSAWEQNAKRN